ncbi:MAG: ABC transporter permease [Candidatus Thermoplasmatota archaeon]
MSKFVVSRLLQGLVTLFIVTSIVFLLFDWMPGDPLSKYKLDPTITEARLSELEREFGLNRPYHEQYFIFMSNMFTLRFGHSYSHNRPVLDILQERLPRTLILFGTETIIVYVLGVMIGSYIGWRRGGVAEGATVVTSLIFYNMPSFWIGLICIWIFSFQLNWFPLSGFSGPEETAAMFKISPSTWGFEYIDFLWHMALPLIVLVLIGIAGVILLMRTSLLEVMGEDYILTAKAKGLTERQVRVRHANRNAYLPVVTSFTISLALAAGGAIILEQIFTYQGIGYTYLHALYDQDHFLAGSTLFIISTLVILGNIVADLLYGWLDPRVRV